MQGQGLTQGRILRKVGDVLLEQLKVIDMPQAIKPLWEKSKLAERLDERVRATE